MSQRNETVSKFILYTNQKSHILEERRRLTKQINLKATHKLGMKEFLKMPAGNK